MLGDSSDRHDPMRVQQVVQQHEEKSPETDAQVKHERDQPGMSEVHRVGGYAQNGQKRSDHDQDQRQLARPRGQLALRLTGRFVFFGTGFFLGRH